MKRLADRVIVVLGGAGGIGAATAKLAGEAGARVVIGDVKRSQPGHRGLAAERPLARYADVTDRESLERLRDAAYEMFGRVDVVVNCAGIIEPGPFDRASYDAIRREFEVNALGVVLVTKIFLDHFVRDGAGHFIHLSSLGGIAPMPHGAAYSATKFAVRGFCLSVAAELADKGVAMTVVCPDSTDTEQLLTEARQEGAPISFTSRPLEPEQVARAIVRAIRRPCREVCVPRRRGPIAKLMGASTGFFQLAYPILSATGTRARQRYLLENERLRGPLALEEVTQ